MIWREPDPADVCSRLIALIAPVAQQLPASKAVMIVVSEPALEGFSVKERAQQLQWLPRIDANPQRALAARSEV